MTEIGGTEIREMRKDIVALRAQLAAEKEAHADTYKAYRAAIKAASDHSENAHAEKGRGDDLADKWRIALRERDTARAERDAAVARNIILHQQKTAEAEAARVDRVPVADYYHRVREVLEKHGVAEAVRDEVRDLPGWDGTEGGYKPGLQTTTFAYREDLVKAEAERDAAITRAESAELGCDIAYRREPTQEEGDAHEDKQHQSMGPDLPTGECFVAMGGWTGRRCRQCGRWVWGGPTACVVCVEKAARDELGIQLAAQSERLRKAMACAASLARLSEAVGSAKILSKGNARVVTPPGIDLDAAQADAVAALAALDAVPGDTLERP